MSAPLLLLDGASMWFRSYFGVPTSITGPDGRPVNAVRGFLDSVATLVTNHRPNRLVVCLDLDWRPAWRVERVPSYKGNRVAEGGADGNRVAEGGADGNRVAQGGADGEDMPDELGPQVSMILAILDAFGIATAGAAGYEADDVLATLAASERHDPVLVVSGDRDLLQLVTDDPIPVRVLYLGRGLAKATTFGPAEVAQQYGVPADRAGAAYAELALLRGDPSDGLPGVSGIGAKTAATLLTRYGSLAAILDAVADPGSDLTASVRARLQAAGDYLQAAGPVVRVARDAPVTIFGGDDQLPSAPTDPARADELAQRYGVSSAVRRLRSALDNR